MPRLGFVERITRSRIIGWAVDTDHLGQPARLRILVNGQPHGRVRADRPRSDRPLMDFVRSHVPAAQHARALAALAPLGSAGAELASLASFVIGRAH